MSDAALAEPASTFERRNPVTGEVATTAQAATVADANAACESAAAAFPAWSALGPNARRAALNKAAAALEARADQFVAGLAQLPRRAARNVGNPSMLVARPEPAAARPLIVAKEQPCLTHFPRGTCARRSSRPPRALRPFAEKPAEAAQSCLLHPRQGRDSPRR